MERYRWLTGWSTQHGDLEIAHFFGLHALQVIPAAALLINAIPAPLGPRTTSRPVTISSVFYAGAVVLLTWQAERGEPMQRPSVIVPATSAGLARIKRSRRVAHHS